MIELYALGVDANKDVGHLLLICTRTQLDDLEAEVPQVANTIDSVFQNILFLMGEFTVSGRFQSGFEVSDDRAVSTGPKNRDVWDELRVFFNGGIGDGKGLVVGSERNADLLFFKLFGEYLFGPS